MTRSQDSPLGIIRQMRRLWITLLVVGAVVALLWGGDTFARHRTESVIVEESGVPTAAVSIAGALYFPQVLRGELDTVTFTADSMMIDGFEVHDVEATLTGVSLAAPHTAQTIEGVARLTPETMTEGVGGGTQVDIEDGTVVLTLDSAPLSASVVPRLDGNRIVLDVTKLSLAGFDVSVDSLPLGLGEALEGSSIEVTGLRDGMRLSEVVVADDGVVVGFAGEDVVLD